MAIVPLTRPLAGGVEDPPSDRDDRTGPRGDVDEVAGSEQAAGG